MAKTVTIPALKSFTHNGQHYRRGDLVAMSAVDAVIYARQGRVSLARQGYTTRQLVAEPKYVEAAEPDHPAEFIIAPRRRRRGRKRALLAEVGE